jgi:hypothetical protein
VDPNQAIVVVAGMITCLLITVAIGWSVVNQAKARSQGSAADRRLEAEVAGLRDRVEELHQQLLDAHERLDFTERLLSQGRAGPVEGGR